MEKETASLHLCNLVGSGMTMAEAKKKLGLIEEPAKKVAKKVAVKKADMADKADKAEESDIL